MAKVTVETKYFSFNQNNSGGGFDINEKNGIGEYVIIEALNKEHACTRAEEIGIYFDGQSAGIDCRCCGDRWDEPWEGGTDSPMLYGKALSSIACAKPEMYRSNIFVHRLNGDVIHLRGDNESYTIYYNGTKKTKKVLDVLT